MTNESLTVRYGKLDTIQKYCFEPVIESFKSDQKSLRGVAPHVDDVFKGELFGSLREKFDSTIDDVEYSCRHNLRALEDTKAGLDRIVRNYTNDEKEKVDALKGVVKNEFDKLDDLEAFKDLSR